MAEEALVYPAEECACRPGLKDPFENPARVAFGEFAGQCVDSCRFRRSLRLRTGDREIEISNFQHEGRFWRARIPLTAAVRPETGFEEFRPGIHHVFLAFNFPKGHPIVLQSQTDPRERREVFALVLSPEGVPPAKRKYSLVDAFRERYALAVRFLSESEFRAHAVTRLKHPVRMFALTLESDQVMALLRAGFDLSEKASFRERYRLFTNNCATNTLDLIDRATHENQKTYAGYFGLIHAFERGLPISGPFGTMGVFRSRQLIKNHSRNLAVGI